MPKTFFIFKLHCICLKILKIPTLVHWRQDVNRAPPVHNSFFFSILVHVKKRIFQDKRHVRARNSISVAKWSESLPPLNSPPSAGLRARPPASIIAICTLCGCKGGRVGEPRGCTSRSLECFRSLQKHPRSLAPLLTPHPPSTPTHIALHFKPNSSALSTQKIRKKRDTLFKFVCK